MSKRRIVRRKSEADPSAAAPFAARHAGQLRPWLLAGATALFVARPLVPSESAADWGDGAPFVMLWLLLAVAIVLAAMVSTWPLRLTGIDAAIVVFLAFHSASGLWAVYHGSPRPALNVLWEFVGLGLGYFSLRLLIIDTRESCALLAVMMALSAALAVHGWHQYFIGYPADREMYRRDPEQALRDANVGPEARRQFEDRLLSDEPTATFALPNSLAGFLAPWLVAALYVAMVGLRDFRRQRPTWLAAGGIAALAASCLIATKSRAGVLAAALGAIAVCVAAYGRLSRRFWQFVAALALCGAALIVGGILVGAVDKEVFTEAGKSLAFRGQYWQATIPIIRDHPWLGCGPGNFQFYYTQYKLPLASEEVKDPHNFLLEIWATAGTPAALALIASLVAGLWVLLWRTGAAKPTGASPHRAGAPAFVLGGALAGYLAGYPFRLLAGMPPALGPMLLGLLVTLVATALLLPWMRRGAIPRFLPAITVCVLLLHLTVSGGIAYSGVAGTLWLLLATGLTMANAGRPAIWPAPWIAKACLPLVALLGVAGFFTSYRPNLNSQLALRLAEADPSAAREHLLDATGADPWSFQPWWRLAAFDFEAWREKRTLQRWAQFEADVARLNRLAPQANGIWMQVGRWHLEAFRLTHRPAMARDAVLALRRAVKLYPNSPFTHANLAIGLRETGWTAEAQREATTALRLHEETPHQDKKLPAELLRKLTKLQRKRSG